MLLGYTNLFSPNNFEKYLKMSSLEFSLKKKDETRNYILEDITNNNLMRKSRKIHVNI